MAFASVCLFGSCFLLALAAFADRHSSGWSYPWYGPPVARLRADFYDGDSFLGDFGVGTSFLSAQGCGYFQSRNINDSDRIELVKLIGVGDPYVASRQ